MEENNQIKILYDKLVDELSKLDYNLPENEKDFKLTDEIKTLISDPNYWPDSQIDIDINNLNHKTICGLVIEHCRNKIIKEFNNKLNNYNLYISDELNDQLKQLQSALKFESVKEVIVYLLENHKKFHLFTIDDVVTREKEINKQKHVNELLIKKYDEITKLTNSIQHIMI